MHHIVCVHVYCINVDCTEVRDLGHASQSCLGFMAKYEQVLHFYLSRGLFALLIYLHMFAGHVESPPILPCCFRFFYFANFSGLAFFFYIAMNIT